MIDEYMFLYFNRDFVLGFVRIKKYIVPKRIVAIISPKVTPDIAAAEVMPSPEFINMTAKK